LGSSSSTTLSTGERIINTKLIVDSSSVYPQDWDAHIVSDTSYAAFNGTNVGLTRDFEGNIVGATPSIGIYQYNGVIPTPCTFTYGQWSTCTNGTQTRSYVVSPIGCTGFPPTDSIQRICTIPIVPCDFTYGEWTTCTNGTQTRTYTSTPSGCIGTPPTDSITRTCTTPIVPCTFTYGAWTTCSNGIQTRPYFYDPFNCVGTPPLDSLTKTCTVPPTSNFYYDGSRISIYIKYNREGRIRITNLLGQSVANIRYSNARNGKYINVSFLAPGSYIATTNGKSIMFTR
jgi:hypothetical protein